MNLNKFRELPEHEQVQKMNERLAELKREKKSVEHFKNEIFEFAYTSAVNQMTNLGYAKEDGVYKKKVELTDLDVKMLKNLIAEYEFVMKQKQEQPQIKRRGDEKVVSSSIRINHKVWKRWQDFCQSWNIFNASDILASSLEKYMDEFGHESYETLVEQGKIKEEEN